MLDPTHRSLTVFPFLFLQLVMMRRQEQPWRHVLGIGVISWHVLSILTLFLSVFPSYSLCTR